MEDVLNLSWHGCLCPFLSTRVNFPRSWFFSASSFLGKGPPWNELGSPHQHGIMTLNRPLSDPLNLKQCALWQLQSWAD